MNSDKVLSLSQVKFRYPGQSTWLVDIDQLEIPRGEKVFLRGPSGCGKSTLLELVAGLLTPTEGKLKVLGQDLPSLSPRQRDRFRAQHVGYIFQRFNLLPYLTAKENIELPLRLKHRATSLSAGGPESPKVQGDLQELSEALGIQEILNQATSQLSVGQQQRVAAARALIGSPELLLADEPTSALDEDHRSRFITLLFELCKRRQTTLLFVSHDRTLESLFDRSFHWEDL